MALCGSKTRVRRFAATGFFLFKHCYCYGEATFGSPPTSPQSDSQIKTTLNQDDFRQHALDIGNRLADLLKQEIAFLSKISNTPITDLDRMTIPSKISTWPATAGTNQPPATNQITINTYAGPTTLHGPASPVGSGQCQSIPIQCATSQSQPFSNPPNSFAGIGQGLPGAGTPNQEVIRPPGGDGMSMGGSFASPYPPPPQLPLPLPYQGGTTGVIQTDQGPVTVEIPPSWSQPVGYFPEQAQPQIESPYNQAQPVAPKPLSNNYVKPFFVDGYKKKPSLTNSQPQLGQANTPTNSQSPFSVLPSNQQPGQNTNPLVAAIPITQQPQQNTSPPAQQPQQPSNPLIGTSPLTTGQTLNPVYVNPGNPTLGYQPGQNNAPPPYTTGQQIPIVGGTQGWPQGQEIYQPPAPIPVTQAQTSQVLPAQSQTTGTVAQPQPGVPPFRAFPATTVSADEPATNV